MFDLSMAEIGVIGVVALLVLGPERLPKAARTVGFYVRKARQSWYSVRSEFERELAAEELKRSLKLDEVHATLQDTAKELQRDLNASGATLESVRAEAGSGLSVISHADPLPGDTGVPQLAHEPSPAVGADDGLSAEELARQSEPLVLPPNATEPEARTLGDVDAAGDDAKDPLAGEVPAVQRSPAIVPAPGPNPNA
jgi:sec-independent protein translocase protein TatB